MRREQQKQTPWFRVIALAALALVAGAIVFLSASALWAEGAGPNRTRRAYIPASFAETGGAAATATPTLSSTATRPPTETATMTATATATATPTATETPTATATEIVDPTQTPRPTRTPKVTPTPTNTPKPGKELLVFDWNQPVTVEHRGFPWDNPPLASANIDWTNPTNFAQGTLHLRVEIFSQPVPQDMKLQFCFWQYNNTLENCTNAVSVSGKKGTVVTWSVGVAQLWKKDGKPIDWANPRARNGVSIKTSKGLPVSDYSNWNWNGEDPNDWYPLNMRFTVVVAEKGAGFSGWDKYIR